jgi:hypothetical protein
MPPKYTESGGRTANGSQESRSAILSDTGRLTQNQARHDEDDPGPLRDSWEEPGRTSESTLPFVSAWGDGGAPWNVEMLGR